MPEYAYIAKDLNGKIVKAKLSANSEKDFYALLRDKNLFCLKKSEVLQQESVNKGSRLKLEELVILTRQFATMQKAGIPIVTCIDILYEQAEKRRVKTILHDIYEHIQKGNSFSSALKEQKKAFPVLYVSMIEAGERSGKLEEVLFRLANHYERERVLLNSVKSAFTYPIILGIVTLAVLAILFVYVIPNFFQLFDLEKMTLPWMTRFLLETSKYVVSHWQGIIVGILEMMCAVAVVFQISYVRRVWDRVKLKIPGVGAVYKMVLSARFSDTLSVLYGSGLSLLEGVELTERVINNAALTRSFSKARGEMVKGKSLSSALREMNIFPSMLINMIAIGEETGELTDILNNTSDYYEKESQHYIKRLLALLEPMMIIILGIIIAVIIAAIIPPMYQMYSHIV